jgi:hypothetical protein
MVGDTGDVCFRAARLLSATLGLSSLDLAFVVAELEAELGVDPFAKLVSITSVRSVGDLVRAYQQALFPEAQRRRRYHRDSGKASSDQASTEKAQLMGRNGSAGVAIVGIACPQSSKIVMMPHLVDEIRSCPLSDCKQILEA